MACEDGELSNAQRAARVAWAIASGEKPTSEELMRLTGYTNNDGLKKLMAHLEGVGGVPIRLCKDGRWRRADRLQEGVQVSGYAF